MSELLKEVKRKAEKLICSEHSKHPEITISGDKINVICCCENLKKKVDVITKETFKNYAKAKIVGIFKKKIS